VRYLGCSNHTPAQLRATFEVCAAHHLPRYEALQPHYNLVHRNEYEAKLMGLCQKEKLGVLPYSPLAGGFLTGKYRRDKSAPANSRGYGNDRMRPYLNEPGYAIIDVLFELSQAHQATAAQTAIAWLLANPTVTSAIVGANTVAQLQDTIKALDVDLSPEDKARLDRLPAPA
jgi:aryl-alcohol dehydrogenase-like predicted oxidoreductase